MIEFDKDPFYLFPIKKELLEDLFVNREEMIAIARGILEMRFVNTKEICVVGGGIGVGKSSMLHYIEKLSEEMGHSVCFFDNPEVFQERSTSGVAEEVVLIDDAGKAGSDEVREFYRDVEKYMSNSGGVVFFADTYDRDNETIKIRNYTTSQNISLPKGLDMEKLRFFLEERMKRCLAPGAEYEFPFQDIALEMASVRSSGNLRSFLGYAKSAWFGAVGKNEDVVTEEEMRSAIISQDMTMLGSCDLVDIRILWYATAGETNKNFLAHQCGIDYRTLESRTGDRLKDLIRQRRSGKDVLVKSIYKYIPGGMDILKKMIKALGIQESEITGSER